MIYEEIKSLTIIFTMRDFKGLKCKFEKNKLLKLRYMYF